MGSIDQSLRTLRDVEGVYGSFVIASSGTLISCDLPAAFDNELFSEVGPRVTRLYETFASGGHELESAMLRYADHKLYLRKMTWGLIGIICGVAVNLPALRMVGNLVVRRIDPEVGAALSRPSPLTPPPLPLQTFRSLVPGSRSTPAPPLVRPTPMPPSVASDTASSAPDVVPEDGRDAVLPTSERHVRMYRGRRVE
jgi:predicted regulator of Ras-like GTPase activity (Roadblock/LC7/MglB family)